MIAIISGSARINSNTLRVAKGLQTVLKDKNLKSTIVNFEGYDVPNFNQKFDPNNLSAWQSNLVETVSQATLVFVLSPEYNWFPSAELMQFANRFGSKNFEAIWDGKTFAMLGVSNGFGGRLPAMHLSNIYNKIISFLDLNSVVHSKIQEVHNVAEIMDVDGNLQHNERFNTGFLRFVDSALIAAKLKG